MAQTDRQTDIETYLGLGDDPMEIYDKPNYHLNIEAQISSIFWCTERSWKILEIVQNIFYNSVEYSYKINIGLLFFWAAV